MATKGTANRHKVRSTRISIDALSTLAFTENQFEANNHEVDRCVIDLLSGLEKSKAERDEQIEDINLHYGEWPTLSPKGLELEMELAEGSIKVGRDHVNHYPYADRISQASVATLLSRYTDPVVPVSYTHLTLPTIYSV